MILPGHLSSLLFAFLFFVHFDFISYTKIFFSSSYWKMRSIQAIVFFLLFYLLFKNFFPRKKYVLWEVSEWTHRSNITENIFFETFSHRSFVRTKEWRRKSDTVWMFQFDICRHVFKDNTFVIYGCFFSFLLVLFTFSDDVSLLIRLLLLFFLFISIVMSTEAFVTLATNDGYALGALTLAESIQQVRTNRNLVVLVSNDLSNLFKFDSISLAIDLKSLFV